MPQFFCCSSVWVFNTSHINIQQQRGQASQASPQQDQSIILCSPLVAFLAVAP